MQRTLLDVFKEIDPERDWDADPVASWQDRLTWPPDVLALTGAVVEEASVYLLAASPPAGKQWPPRTDWYEEVRLVGSLWQAWAHFDAQPAPTSPAPSALERVANELPRYLGLPVSELATGRDWRAVAAVLSLHALADQACAGLGLPGEQGFRPDTGGDATSSFYFQDATDQLSRTGSLARLSPSRVRVLPKMRTPQVGITPRSMSLHAAIDRSGLGVECLLQGELCAADEERFNLLLLPWPMDIRPNHFQPVPRRGEEISADVSRSRFFRFQPREPFDTSLLERTLCSALRDTGDVHGVVLPEAAVDESELAAITPVLSRHGVKLLLTGVRAKRRNFARLALEVRKERWLTYDQDKHHRWALDATQIQTYHLGSRLHTGYRWWEAIDLSPRSVNLVIANSWLTIAHLICEDLARAGPGVDIVRAVGPTLVIALLLDGPQLAARWPGRYASVLADDPGSSVLTLTAAGMTERSRPPGKAASRKVALWKDASTGVTELELEPGAEGILLSLCVDWHREWTADGRDDGRSAAHLIFGGAEPVHATRCPEEEPAGPRRRGSSRRSPAAQPRSPGGSKKAAKGREAEARKRAR